MSRIFLLLLAGGAMLPASNVHRNLMDPRRPRPRPGFSRKGRIPSRLGPTTHLVSPPDARYLGHEGDHYAVATDHQEATRAAIHALEHGGNAVADAAIAAATTLGVVSPSASGLGGGGFALVFMQRDESIRAFDFRETAGAGVDRETWEKSTRRGKYIGVR